MTSATYDRDRGFTLDRKLDAPRAAVFRAWTDPAHLDWFFNPGMPVRDPIELDLRPGGAWRQKMVENADTEYITGGIYQEIIPVERLVFLHGATDGWPKIDLDHPEDSIRITVTFEEIGDQDRKTGMRLRVDFPDHLTDAEVDAWKASGMRDGWGQTIDRLPGSLV